MEVKILQSENQIYQKVRLLGQGAFGKAYLVKKKQTGELLVIKEVSIDHMSQKEREETIKEAQILRNLRSPLIVKFVQVYATKQNKLKIVMEYAECGDLSKAIATKRTQKQNFQENQILDWFTQICLAMKHVHDRKILHRDIKGQNIFITKNNTLKLGDFGIARVLNKTQDKARTVVGTPYYLSPQIIENKPYSFKSDIWSMGVLLYQLCALSPPFNANSLQMLALKIVKGSYTPITVNYSKQLKGLIGQILQVDTNKRPSISDILKKPIISERIRKFLSETYRNQQFSHTVLHNQKVQISNKLVKVQDKMQDDKKIEQQRIKLKEEANMLKQKMDKKKDLERAKQQERLRRRKQEQLLRRQEEAQRKREQQAKNKQFQQKRADLERKQWVERQKRKQEENRNNYQQQQRRRVYQIAENAKRRQKEERQLISRKEELLREKYQIERRRQHQVQAKKKVNKEQDENKKIQQLNQFARKQFFQNQMIRKRAQERAKQAQMQAYSGPSYQQQQPKQPSRPQSYKDINTNQRQSREKKKDSYQYEPNQKRNSVQYNPKEQELQDVFPKKTPSSIKSKNVEVKAPVNVQSWNSKIKQQKSKEQGKNKKNYDQSRQQIKKDREQFIKGKNYKNNEIDPKQIETLKCAKWQKRPNSRQKSQVQKSPQPIKKAQSPLTTEDDTIADSEFEQLHIKDQQEFNDYLKQLQGLLDNVNKNVEKLEILPQIPVVQEKIILRQDDVQELDYSMTASFEDISKPEVNIENADFDLFSDYSKLEDLRMCLEDKFGTDNFIKIYRALENQLQTKGLQNFNILQIMQSFGKDVDVNLVTQNLAMLLTLVVMQQKMSSA